MTRILVKYKEGWSCIFRPASFNIMNIGLAGGEGDVITFILAIGS